MKLTTVPTSISFPKTWWVLLQSRIVVKKNFSNYPLFNLGKKINLLSNLLAELHYAINKGSS